MHPLCAISVGRSSPLNCVSFKITIKSYKTMDLIKIAEEAFATKKEYPSFKSGDTITVAYRIKEGNKERIQQYRGVVYPYLRTW